MVRYVSIAETELLPVLDEKVLTFMQLTPQMLRGMRGRMPPRSTTLYGREERVSESFSIWSSRTCGMDGLGLQIGQDGIVSMEVKKSAHR